MSGCSANPILHISPNYKQRPVSYVQELIKLQHTSHSLVWPFYVFNPLLVLHHRILINISIQRLFPGVLSLNVTVPQSPTSYHGFGIVIALCSLILGGYAYVVRWWWIQAERRRSEQSFKQIGLRRPPQL